MKKTSAFTLIELLIAISIFSIVIVSIYSAFHVGILSYQKANVTGSAHRSARILCNRMELDLRNAYSYAKEDSRFTGSASSVQFFSVIDFYELAKAYSEPCFVKYEVQDAGVKRKVLRGADAFRVDPLEEIIPGVFKADKVVFEYATPSATAEAGYEWSDNWPKDESLKDTVPLAVRVTVTMLEKSKYNPEGRSVEFKKIIPLPLGGR